MRNDDESEKQEHSKPEGISFHGSHSALSWVPPGGSVGLIEIRPQKCISRGSKVSTGLEIVQPGAFCEAAIVVSLQNPNKPTIPRGGAAPPQAGRGMYAPHADEFAEQGYSRSMRGYTPRPFYVPSRCNGPADWWICSRISGILVFAVTASRLAVRHRLRRCSPTCTRTEEG